ncbi:uncharacterized protein K452DRAFT_297058 [Aplosporella prunicola CBS 121167]|uniref:Uncharacterized protein n=1 Tax=Aplosporella prunicola CBS 121167 TaxID=1176127 RepID=A0A6A6BGL6_9PEZI|nr:uncharacterized protein K452DRAFT_297058 [Aplosporella prunicola CBS 121167]KAF2143302.1 hypothetical protein K452DRAFT_297058 [Aplosporella prunicola CBS 121167]
MSDSDVSARPLSPVSKIDERLRGWDQETTQMEDQLKELESKCQQDIDLIGNKLEGLCNDIKSLEEREQELLSEWQTSVSGTQSEDDYARNIKTIHETIMCLKQKKLALEKEVKERLQRYYKEQKDIEEDHRRIRESRKADEKPDDGGALDNGYLLDADIDDIFENQHDEAAESDEETELRETPDSADEDTHDTTDGVEELSYDEEEKKPHGVPGHEDNDEVSHRDEYDELYGMSDSEDGGNTNRTNDDNHSRTDESPDHKSDAHENRMDEAEDGDYSNTITRKQKESHPEKHSRDGNEGNSEDVRITTLHLSNLDVQEQTNHMMGNGEGESRAETEDERKEDKENERKEKKKEKRKRQKERKKQENERAKNEEKLTSKAEGETGAPKESATSLPLLDQQEDPEKVDRETNKNSDETRNGDYNDKAMLPCDLDGVNKDHSSAQARSEQPKTTTETGAKDMPDSPTTTEHVEGGNTEDRLQNTQQLDQPGIKQSKQNDKSTDDGGPIQSNSKATASEESKFKETVASTTQREALNERPDTRRGWYEDGMQVVDTLSGEDTLFHGEEDPIPPDEGNGILHDEEPGPTKGSTMGKEPAKGE